MLKCNGKTFMNLQEAVQWLLNNNALFFLCTEDYAADTEISVEELVNPSPANPKIGSLVLFADGNIAVITGITDDSFIVGSDSINIRAQKAVTNFTIDASQHLIVHYSDGTSDDLGSILSGNVNIDGVLTADEAKILENIEDKDGHLRFVEGTFALNPGSGAVGINVSYAKWSLSGTHLMIVLAGSVENGSVNPWVSTLTAITMPDWIKQKILPIYSDRVDRKVIASFSSDGATEQNITFYLRKTSEQLLYISMGSFTASAERFFRLQFDLLIDDE